jgi:hypothetical protein
MALPALMSPPGLRHQHRHALILGAIGLVVSLIGVMASMQMNMGPVWYPAMVAAAALPCSFLGGYLFSLKKS